MARHLTAILFAAIAVLCVASAAAQADPNHIWGRPGKIKNGCGFRARTLQLPFYPQTNTSIFPTTAAVQNVPQGTNVVRSFFVGTPNTPEAREGSSTANVMIMDADVGGKLRISSCIINIKFEGKTYTGRLSLSGNLYFDYSGAAPSVTSEMVIVGGTGDFLGAVGYMTTAIVGGVGNLVMTLQVPVRNCFNE